MGIKLPPALHAAITEADQRVGDIDEIELAELLNATLGPHASLSPEERKGAFAEVGALYFIPVRDRVRSAWDMYWQPLGTGITADGIEYHSPDVSLADDEVIAHWARRGRVTGSSFPHDKVVPGLALPLGVIGVTARAPAHYVYELRLREPIRSAQTETPPCSRH